jgi:hypothetical protein
MKPAFTVTYRVSKTFKAPLDFVYSWCTDFQEGDLRMIGSKNRRSIHEKSGRRVIWTVEGRGLKGETDPVRAVWLRPPDAWHLEGCGDGMETGDYRLVSLGKSRTRLDMEFTEMVFSKADLQSGKELVAIAKDHWEKYGKALESDFRASLPRTTRS